MKMKAPEGLMKYLNETVRNGNEMVMKWSHYPCLYFMRDSNDKMNEIDGQS